MLCTRKCKLCVRILFYLPASANSPQFEHHTRGGLALFLRLLNLLAYYRTCSGKILFTCCLGMGVSKSLKRQSSISEGLSRQRRCPETAQNVHCYLSLGVATGTRNICHVIPIGAPPTHYYSPVLLLMFAQLNETYLIWR